MLRDAERPAGMGMPALQNGNGRRAWERPPYSTALQGQDAKVLPNDLTAGGQGCARPTANGMAGGEGP